MFYQELTFYCFTLFFIGLVGFIIYSKNVIFFLIFLELMYLSILTFVLYLYSVNGLKFNLIIVLCILTITTIETVFFLVLLSSFKDKDSVDKDF